ncbi:DUF4352 domain-containing protein [Nocardia camponoti]|uniref:Mpr protein n=1 Tax=Nocardia camponoti TaxID=1616106 RepID=A0A917QDY5_9NOCA|nr:DUF4352 domain-containing protein [Nocardia camponoti]GGK46149.1 Mpr protein [Nocardia camponoti]
MSYPQQSVPQQPYYPQQPPKKRKVWPWVLGSIALVFLLMFAGCAALFGSAANEVSKEAAARSSAAPAGTEVRDGKFGFTVTGVDAPVATVGTNQFLQKTAQGEFIQVHVDIANTSNVAQTYFGSDQKLIDTQGREFKNDTAAELNVNDSSVIGTINPGNKVSVILVFDVPAGTTPAAIEFHDSAFSNGARVAVN